MHYHRLCQFRRRTRCRQRRIDPPLLVASNQPRLVTAQARKCILASLAHLAALVTVVSGVMPVFVGPDAAVVERPIIITLADGARCDASISDCMRIASELPALAELPIGAAVGTPAEVGPAR